MGRWPEGPEGSWPSSLKAHDPSVRCADTSPASLLRCGHISRKSRLPRLTGEVARRAGGGKPQERYLLIPDLKFSRMLCVAFPPPPPTRGSPPPLKGGGKTSFLHT